MAASPTRNRAKAEVANDEDLSSLPAVAGVNEVRLVGRLSGLPEPKVLPSGDEVVQLRLVVRRPPEPARPKATTEKGPRPVVDTIDVSCWTAVTRRTALRFTDGDIVEVEGALRRRFYRAGAAVQSRYDVVASAVRRPKR